MCFMFIKSICTSDFELFVRIVSYIIPWMFSFDQMNYSRWLPAFLLDMKQIPRAKAEAFNLLTKGSFILKISPRVFSNIRIDQAHGQYKKDIKIDTGSTGLTDDSLSNRRLVGQL